MAFSWGVSNSSSTNNNNNFNGNSSSAFGTSGWGSNNNNKSNANPSSFGFGGGNGNGNGNGSEGNNASSFGTSNINNGSCFGLNTSAAAPSPWGSNANSNANTQQNQQNGNARVVNPNNDHVVGDTATESISSLAFHPHSAHFVVGAWDNSLRYYEFNGNGASQSRKVAQQSHSKPILSVCFDTNSGDRVFSAGCDNAIKQWAPQQNAFTEVGTHSAPVRSVLFSAEGNMVLSGSWDKTVAAWDARSSNQKSALRTDLGHKVFAMATHGHLLVVGCSDHDIRTIDLRQSGKVVHSVRDEVKQNQNSVNGKKAKDVSLKKQIRTIDMFPNGEGYVAASVGGRVVIKHLDRSRAMAAKDFSYKCHRHAVNGGARNGGVNHIFAVNVVRFHRQTAVFATAGDDGECVTWDKDGRAKLFTFKEMRIDNAQNENNVDCSRMPIVALDYHSNGQFMLYATSYNWNKGAEFNRPLLQRPTVYLHQVSPKEMDKSKNKK